MIRGPLCVFFVLYVLYLFRVWFSLGCVYFLCFVVAIFFCFVVCLHMFVSGLHVFISVFCLCYLSYILRLDFFRGADKGRLGLPACLSWAHHGNLI